MNVTAFGPVNEASTYAMFTVTAASGDALTLALGNTATTADRDATLTSPMIEYSTDGTNWTTYTWTGSTGDRPTVPGGLGSGTGTVYVRVTITSESDTAYEGAETFTLTATSAANTSITDVDTATIIDDGTGSKYPGTITSGTPNSNTTGLDNDLSVNAVSYTHLTLPTKA